MLKYTEEQIREAVSSSLSVRASMLKLGMKLTGGSHSYISKRIKKFNIDTSHFLGKAARSGITSTNRKSASEILILRKDGARQQAYQLKRALLEVGVKHACAECGQLPEWKGNPLTLEIDHIDENWLDDRKENLRFLCPNCHSQFTRKLKHS